MLALLHALHLLSDFQRRTRNILTDRRMHRKLSDAHPSSATSCSGLSTTSGSRLILKILAGAVTVIVITWLRDRVRAKRGGV